MTVMAPLASGYDRQDNQPRACGPFARMFASKRYTAAPIWQRLEAMQEWTLRIQALTSPLGQM